MLAVSDPIDYDITIVCGTDKTWSFRRRDTEGNPIIPEFGRAQIRLGYGKTLWAEPEVTINESGWVSVSLAKESTQGSEWLERRVGRWDLEVILNGNTYRWVQGAATVSNEVTEDE